VGALRTLRIMISRKNIIDKCLTHCINSGISDRGLQIAEEIMRSEPARRVSASGSVGNSATRFVSQKMGVIIQSESKTGELPNIYHKEFDKSVIGYWDQPHHRVELDYVSKGGRRCRTTSTLDFFVVSDGFIGFEECKPQYQLQRLINENPNRFKYNKNMRKYEIPPLATYLEGTGLEHRVVVNDEFENLVTKNIMFLYAYAGLDKNKEYEGKIGKVRSLMTELQSLSIAELTTLIPNLNRRDIYQALWSQDLFSDLSSKEIVKEDENLIIHLKKPSEKEDGKEQSKCLTEPLLGDPRYTEEVTRRWGLIKPVIERKRSISFVAKNGGGCRKKISRWVKSYEEKGILGLYPQHSKKGNYQHKISQTNINDIENLINEEYIKSSAPSVVHVYRLYVHSCEQKCQRPVSKSTFHQFVREMTDKNSIRRREGSKRAYKETEFTEEYDTEERKIFRKTSYFLERCHIDHTELDLEIVSDSGANLGRPWLTAIIDEYSKYVLTIHLSFDRPSSKTLMNTIRSLVSRHKVLPMTFVVDGGGEFESKYFETFSANYQCHIDSRRGSPQGGAPVERFFGELGVQTINNMTGNTKNMKDVRSVSRSHNPKRNSLWTPNELNNFLEERINHYNSTYAVIGEDSPEQMKCKSNERCETDIVKHVEFDNDFLMNTLLAPNPETRRISRKGAVNVNNIEYRNSSFDVKRNVGETVFVRYDPSNKNAVYAYVGKKWHLFKSTHYFPIQESYFGLLDSEISERLNNLKLKKREKSRKESAVKLNEAESKLKKKTSIKNSSEDMEKIGPKKETQEKKDKGDIWKRVIPTHFKDE